MKNKLCSSDAREAVAQDDKVLAALSDLIAAVQIYGQDHVTGDHLKSVISMRLESYESDEDTLDYNEDDTTEYA